MLRWTTKKLPPNNTRIILAISTTNLYLKAKVKRLVIFYCFRLYWLLILKSYMHQAPCCIERFRRCANKQDVYSVVSCSLCPLKAGKASFKTRKTGLFIFMKKRIDSNDNTTTNPCQFFYGIRVYMGSKIIWASSTFVTKVKISSNCLVPDSFSLWA